MANALKRIPQVQNVHISAGQVTRTTLEYYPGQFHPIMNYSFADQLGRWHRVTFDLVASNDAAGKPTVVYNVVAATGGEDSPVGSRVWNRIEVECGATGVIVTR